MTEPPSPMPPLDAATIVRHSFGAAVAAADPLGAQGFMARALGAAPATRVVVVGAGKAAASMAAAVERAWPDVATTGLVVTHRDHGCPTRSIEVVEAADAVPDDADGSAGSRVLALVDALGRDDLLLVLLSGGGSRLLSSPAPGLTMEGLQRLERALGASSASAAAKDVVRKHCSAIAGGRLAEAAVRRGATVRALIVSDVVGDDPASIASGPCTPDPSTYADALALVELRRIDLPYGVRNHLERGVDGALPETPKAGDPTFARVTVQVVATAQTSLEAANDLLRARGVAVANLGATVTGEAREVAKVFAALVREIRAHALPWTPPVALVSAGTCSVALPRPDPRDRQAGKRRGGPCTEFLLALAIELDGAPGVHALACDTDGIDGSQDNAGATLAPDSLARARAAGVDPEDALDQHDAWRFFATIDDLVVTGPSRTGVGEYRVILVT